MPSYLYRRKCVEAVGTGCVNEPIAGISMRQAQRAQPGRNKLLLAARVLCALRAIWAFVNFMNY